MCQWMSPIQSPNALSIPPAAALPIRVNVGQESLEHLHFPHTPDKELSPDFTLCSFNQSTGLNVSAPSTKLDDSKYTQNMTASHPDSKYTQNMTASHPIPCYCPVHSSCSPNKHSSKWDPLRNINHSMSHLCSSHFPCSIRPYMRSNIYEEHTHRKE